LKTELQREQVTAARSRFAIVVSRWNRELTSKLEERSHRGFTQAGAGDAVIEVFSVPGSFELPWRRLKAAQSGNFDAVVALGVVIRGDTPHFDFVAGQAAPALCRLPANWHTGHVWGHNCQYRRAGP
jgi:6,7-dimethyl-8-ribityllumazine synthase